MLEFLSDLTMHPSKDFVDASTIIAGIAAVLTLLLSLWLIFRDRLSLRCSAFYRSAKRNTKEAKLQILTGRNGAKIRSIRLYEYNSPIDRFLDWKWKQVSEELATPNFVRDGLYVQANDVRVVIYRLPKRLERPAKEGRLWFHVTTSIGKKRCNIPGQEMPSLNMGLSDKPRNVP